MFTFATSNIWIFPPKMAKCNLQIHMLIFDVVEKMKLSWVIFKHCDCAVLVFKLIYVMGLLNL